MTSEDENVYNNPRSMSPIDDSDYSNDILSGQSNGEQGIEGEESRAGGELGSVRDQPELPDSLDEYNPNKLGGREEFCIYCKAVVPHVPTELCELTNSTEPESLEGVIQGMADLIPTEPVRLGRPTIDDGALMKDPISTGRKRAALAAPINVGMICEWAYLKKAGGGVEPIQGCTGYPATDRHHGPNKATLDNTTEENPSNDGTWNLHRICSMCHNRWHSANDRFYDEPRPADNTIWNPNTEFQEHDPLDKMTKVEAFMLEATRGQIIGD